MLLRFFYNAGPRSNGSRACVEKIHQKVLSSSYHMHALLGNTLFDRPSVAKDLQSITQVVKDREFS
jgi:hypothetical protein